MPTVIVRARRPYRPKSHKKLRPEPECGFVVTARTPKDIQSQRSRMVTFDSKAEPADLFPVRSPATVPVMSQATPEEIAECLAFAMKAEGRAKDTMAKIAADRIVQHLEASGFVLIKKEDLDVPID